MVAIHTDARTLEPPRRRAPPRRVAPRASNPLDAAGSPCLSPPARALRPTRRASHRARIARPRRLPSRRTRARRAAASARAEARRRSRSRPARAAALSVSASATPPPGARDDVSRAPEPRHLTTARAWTPGPAPTPAAQYAKIVVEDAGDHDTTLVRCQGFDRTGQLASLTIASASFGLQIKSAPSSARITTAPTSTISSTCRRARASPVSPSSSTPRSSHTWSTRSACPPAATAWTTSPPRATRASSGGDDESAQSRAALEQTHRANARRSESSGGFFSSDTAGASLFDPNACVVRPGSRGDRAPSRR